MRHIQFAFCWWRWALPGLASLGEPRAGGYVLDVGQAKDVAIDTQAGVAYVASLQFGLAAVEITNPAHLCPIERQSCLLRGARGRRRTIGVAVSGNSG